jgi:hypothetical protein
MGSDAAAAGSMGSDAAAAAAAGFGEGFVPIRPHPRIDAVHPLGEAHSSEELENALKLYKQIVEGERLVWVV